MPGRGDNNKHGSAGRGASNQSNQPFATDNERQPASNHNRAAGNNKHYEMAVDGVPYIINASPFEFNTEIRYVVKVNGTEEYLFLWDNSVGRFAAVGDNSSLLPDNLENVIAQKLQQEYKKDAVV
jgi:hypothetical protein